MISNRRIRGALYGAACLLAAALSFIALRAAYPRAETAGDNSASVIPSESPAAGVRPEPIVEPAPSVTELPATPALVTRTARPRARNAARSQKATEEAPCASEARAAGAARVSVTCQENLDPTAPSLRVMGAGGRATPRRVATETRHEIETMRRSPVRMMTLGESTW